MDNSVVRMANQIARNFEVLGHDKAVAATADHIVKFWDPRMRDTAFALVGKADNGFSPIASAAIGTLTCDREAKSLSQSTE